MIRSLIILPSNRKNLNQSLRPQTPFVRVKLVFMSDIPIFYSYLSILLICHNIFLRALLLALSYLLSKIG